MKAYGFRNIQNLMIKLKQNASKIRHECIYIEVMACPGGCTNGGGQIRWAIFANPSTACSTSLPIESASPVAEKAADRLQRVNDLYASQVVADADAPNPWLSNCPAVDLYTSYAELQSVAGSINW